MVERSSVRPGRSGCAALKRVLNLLAVAAVAACGSACETTPHEQVLRLPIASEPPTLDWNVATDNVSLRVLTQIMEGLTFIDAHGQVRPALAERWVYQPEVPSYIFVLKKGVVWSDGVPLTSAHFVESIKRLLSPETGSQYAYFVFDINGARCFNEGRCPWSQVGVKALDKRTVQFILEKPAVYFPYIVSFMVTYPIRPDVLEARGEKAFEPPFPVVGPYVPLEWRHHYKIVLATNPRYHGRKPFVPRVEMYVVEEPLTALLLFETGDLDMAPLFPLAYRRYRTDPRFRDVTVFRGYYYGFHITQEPVNHVELRRALAMAINREAVAEALRGIATPASSWIPPGMSGYNPRVGLRFDPEEARKWLEKYYKETGRNSVELTIYFNASPENQVVAENVQEQWKKNLNINVNLEMMEWNAYLQMLDENPPAVFRLGWGADFPDPHNFMEIFTSWSGNNHTGWHSSLYDRLIIEASQERDSKRRFELYTRAQPLLLEEDVVIVPLFFSRATYLTNPHFRNLEITPMDILYVKDVVPED